MKIHTQKGEHSCKCKELAYYERREWMFLDSLAVYSIMIDSSECQWRHGGDFLKID